MALVFDPATMSTGDSVIDGQHRQLIAKLNELFSLMQQGKGGEGLQSLLTFVENYTKAHFSFEEGCFQRASCPAHAENVAAHREFIRVWTEFRAKLATDGPTTSLVLQAQRQLSEWLRNHICRTDVQLRACVSGID